MAKPFAIARVLGALLLVSTVAGAEPPSTPAQRARAGELVKQAIAKSQSGEHEAAIDLYQQAYMLVPQPLLLSNIGSEYQQQGKKIEAVKYFCKYLTEDPNGTNASYATAQAKALQIELGNQTDDKDVCKAKPRPPEPPPPPPPPLAPIKDPAPLANNPSEVPVGGLGGPEHPVTSGPSHALEYTGIAVGVVGVAAFGLGVYYGFQAKDISDSISGHDPTKPWPTDIKAQEAEGQSDQDRQVLFMISGGIVAGAGAFLAWRGHHSASAEHVSLRPIATPSQVGLAVGGGF